MNVCLPRFGNAGIVTSQLSNEISYCHVYVSFQDLCGAPSSIIPRRAVYMIVPFDLRAMGVN